MGIITNRRRVMGGGQPLPYDAVVEYLESTGLEKIITNFYVDNTIEFEYSYMTLKNNLQNSLVFAFKSNATCFGLFISTITRLGYYMGSKSVRNINYTHNIMVTVRGKQGKLYDVTDGTERLMCDVSDYGTFVSDTPLSFFNNSDGNTKQQGYVFYGFKAHTISDSIDLISVRVGTTGYMYDRVSGQLFGSATGEFIVGPDVSN